MKVVFSFSSFLIENLEFGMVAENLIAFLDTSSLPMSSSDPYTELP
jgi:hypothetical protein